MYSENTIFAILRIHKKSLYFYFNFYFSSGIRCIYSLIFFIIIMTKEDKEENNISIEENKEDDVGTETPSEPEKKHIKFRQSEEEYTELYDKSYLVNNLVNTSIVQKLKKFFDTLPGIYYCTIHMLFMVLIGVIIFFVTNKTYLCMTLLVISLDAVANVVFFDCPLSSLEKKYLNTSMVETRLTSLQKWGMMYANDRCYDTQLEVIINGWTLCAAKILTLIVMDSFHIGTNSNSVL